MKLITYQAQDVALGVLTADEQSIIPLGSLSLSRQFCTMLELIEAATEADLQAIATAAKEGGDPVHLLPLASCKLLPPIRHPKHDVICVGVNYASHLAETEKEMKGSFQRPTHSVYFGKRALQITGPDEPIEGHLAIDECLDYEVELAVILGKSGRDIPKEQAEDYIFGYSVFNDVSARTLQKQHNQWYKGKSLDSFSVLGPCIVHKSALPLPVHVEVESRVNGEVRQHANTSTLLADVASLIADLSRGMTLEAGDIIATGTPAGVAMGMEHPLYMKTGDVVECKIEGIGVLRNKIV